MPSEVTLNQVPVKIDGVSQEVAVPELGFKPEGVLEHKYIPMETVIVKEVWNDLLYSCSYWDVETLWRIFLNKNTYKRLMSKFLNGFEVVVDYRNPKRPKAFLPRDQKVDGFTSISGYRRKY